MVRLQRWPWNNIGYKSRAVPTRDAAFQIIIRTHIINTTAQRPRLPATSKPSPNHLQTVYPSPSQNVPLVPGTMHQLQPYHGCGQVRWGLRKRESPSECGQHHDRPGKVQHLQSQRPVGSIQQVGVLVPSQGAVLPGAFCWGRPELRFADHDAPRQGAVKSSGALGLESCVAKDSAGH